MISLYTDEHVPQAAIEQLRMRGIDILTVFEDGRAEAEDANLELICKVMDADELCDQLIRIPI
jgi:hypothetical protein